MAGIEEMIAKMLAPRGSSSCRPPSKSPWLKIHEHDSDVPSCFMVDPHTWVAEHEAKRHTPEWRWCSPWGLHLPDDFQMRYFMNSRLYMFEDSPDVQFVKILASRKLKQLRSTPPATSDLIIDVVLDEVTPRVWRRVRVSARTPLAALVDKVLLPLMGWDRNYHAWIFMDPKDWSIFGPAANNSAIDMMHVPLHAIYMIDTEAEKVTLGHLLKAAGEELGWIYDLGDRWRHNLKVVEVVPTDDSCGKVIVMDGAMQCPPEDSAGSSNLLFTTCSMHMNAPRETSG
jgi:hypothetical protein